MIDKLRPVGPGAVPDVDPDLVRRALATFASTSGAGPSRLRPSHLQDALRYSSGDQTLRLLSEVVLLMMTGEIPEDVRPWVCGASLMALRKLNGSLRPVAVGETLRRLCSKVCVDLMGSSVHSILEPVQVGVQTRFGCEAVVHTTRHWAHTFRDDLDRVLVLIDLANAFNCVSRGAVLSTVRTHFPWLAPWADSCYRYDSNLLLAAHRSTVRVVFSKATHSAHPSSHWQSIPASLRLLVSQNRASQVISTTTPSSSTMGHCR